MLMSRIIRAGEILSVIGAILATLATVATVWVVRALPEDIGLPTLVFLIPVILIGGALGVLVGGFIFGRTRRRTAFIGLLIGEAVLLVVVLYGLSWWFWPWR